MANNQFLNVPLSIPDHGQHLRLISSALNNTIDGKLNSTGTFTTDGTKTLKTVIDARCGGNSVVLFVPTTVDAAFLSSYARVVSSAIFCCVSSV